MKYMIVISESEGDFARRDDPEHAGAYWESWQVYGQLIANADPDFTGVALQAPETGTFIRGKGAGKQVQDGPFADAKEHLGGFFIVDVADLDAALALAAECPAVENGHVEVRPVLPMNT